MIQQVHTHLHICFDETKLAARFPSYRPPPSSTTSSDLKLNPNPNSTSTSPSKPSPKWYHGRIQHISTGLLAVIGKKGRKAGCINCSGGATDLKVHIGARLRNSLDDGNAVPGYTLMVPVTGKSYWARRRQRSRWCWPSYSDEDAASTESLGATNRRPNSRARMAERIEEAEVGPLEARLLGLPEEVVG
jgi:hypothetical protein